MHQQPCASLNYLSPRYHFVRKFGEKYNLRFTNLLGSKNYQHKWKAEIAETIKKLPQIYPTLFSQWISRAKMMSHKYLLCIDGIDYASNFIWALKSNSLVLATPSNWDIVISVGLEKWKHFIPIKSDGSDLEKKLKWCRENDDLCRQIAERATNYLKYYNEETENRIE